MARLAETLKTIEHHRRQSPHYSELLDVLEEILILREDYKRNFPEILFPIVEHHIREKLAGGFPLLDFSTVTFDATRPREYFFSLMRIAEKRSPEETKDIAGKIIDGTLQYEQMIRRMFQPLEEKQDEDGKEGDEESFDLVELFLEESLRPELEKVADKYRDQIEASSWEEGYCPVCGKEPKIGQIKDDENRRYLFCNQCGFEWSFMRIRCPFCGNEDQQELAYFTVEDDERYRVDVCNACKRYIKMVDFRESKEIPNLDVEDIATLHLDMLANDEGYE